MWHWIHFVHVILLGARSQTQKTDLELWLEATYFSCGYALTNMQTLLRGDFVSIAGIAV
jgi:hypothetical protein